MTKCYRCGKEIESASQLSLDHKKDWFHSESPSELFWDLENLAFSHHACNSLAGLDNVTKNRNATKLGKGNKKWQSRYWNGKKQVFVGNFYTPEEATEASKKAKIEWLNTI